MSWPTRVPTRDTGPERSARRLLDEMGLRYTMNEYLDTPFRDYPIQADLLVEDCLVIEVQSRFFHEKARRHRKDQAKKRCFQAMGLGELELWDEELRYADQVERGKVWRPYLKAMIRAMLDYSKTLRRNYLAYLASVPRMPQVTHPTFGVVEVETRNE